MVHRPFKTVLGASKVTSPHFMQSTSCSRDATTLRPCAPAFAANKEAYHPCCHPPPRHSHARHLWPAMVAQETRSQPDSAHHLNTKRHRPFFCPVRSSPNCPLEPAPCPDHIDTARTAAPTRHRAASDHFRIARSATAAPLDQASHTGACQAAGYPAIRTRVNSHDPLTRAVVRK